MTTDTTRPLALVTGASSGIGFQLAKHFADNGFDPIIAAEDAELTTANSDLQAAGAHADALRVDLATEEGVEGLHRLVRAASRPLDARCPERRNRRRRRVRDRY